MDSVKYGEICTLVRNINYLADKRRAYELGTLERDDITDKIIDMEFVLQRLAKENNCEIYRFKRSGHWVFEII